MAEYLFSKLIEIEGRSDELVISSAGVAAIENDLAANQAIEVLCGKGIDGICEHKATLINDSIVKDADLILTMTSSHRELILNKYPEVEEKVYILKEYTIKTEENENEIYNLDIKDPYGQSVEVYKACASELEVSLKKLLVKV